MSPFQSLQAQRLEIVNRMAQLGPMRKGLLSVQFFASTNPTRKRRGPFLLYTRKESRKTLSRRLAPETESIYRTQIERWREFRALVERLVDIDRGLADIEVTEALGKGAKKNSRS